MKLDATVLLLATLALSACVSSSPDATERTAVVRSGDSLPSDVSGTWVFDLDASDVAAPIREECAKEANPSTCWSGIATEAKREKIRFTDGDANGRATWTSFAADPAGEIVFVSMPVDLVADGTGHLMAKVAGPPTGTKAAQFEKAHVSQLRVEVVDARTIAMIDPKKGRLVFTKE